MFENVAAKELKKLRRLTSFDKVTYAWLEGARFLARVHAGEEPTRRCGKCSAPTRAPLTSEGLLCEPCLGKVAK